MDHQTSESRRLGAGLVLLLALLIFEIVGSVRSGSLALLGDAGHVLMDVVALGASFVASRVAQRRPTTAFTFGFSRIEIIVAFANGLALLALSIGLTIYGVGQLVTPHPVRGQELLVYASIGLIGNLACLALLHRGRHGGLNLESAFWHVLGDTLSSVFVVGGAILIAATGENRFDVIASFAVAVLLFIGAVRLVRRAGRVLLEGTELDLAAVEAVIRSVPGVAKVHHVHARTLTDGVTTLTARVHPAGDPRLSECVPLLQAIETVLSARFDIRHITIQFETSHIDRAVECALDRPHAR